MKRTPPWASSNETYRAGPNETSRGGEGQLTVRGVRLLDDFEYHEPRARTVTARLGHTVLSCAPCFSCLGLSQQGLGWSLRCWHSIAFAFTLQQIELCFVVSCLKQNKRSGAEHASPSTHAGPSPPPPPKRFPRLFHGRLPRTHPSLQIRFNFPAFH